MSDEPVVVQSEKYKESDDHIPNPTDLYGTLDTSGTSGKADSDLNEVTKIFEVAKAQDLAVAGRALDPEDEDVPEHLVVLPEGVTQVVGDPEAAKKRVANKAAKAAREKVVLGGGETPAQEAAAEEGPDKALDAQAQQESSGAGSIGTGGVDAEKRAELREDAEDETAGGKKGRKTNK